MSEQPWGIDADNPLDEGSEPTAVGDGSIAEQRAAQDPTAQDGTDVRPPDRPIAYDPDEEHQPQAGEQGGQPNLSPDPAVAGRRSSLGQGSTDDSPGTPSGI
ncbi:hypothetical protein AB0J80_21405 [Actinoplanes sp. NPDC049548]|uniref:hypothetical protein n=1 Tax=Actinoplanes sp. NPDC049548 TaxID=3155152 RepID=UPI0034332397